MTTFAGGQEGAEPDDMGHGEKKCVMKTHKFVFLFRISFRCCADCVEKARSETLLIFCWKGPMWQLRRAMLWPTNKNNLRSIIVIGRLLVFIKRKCSCQAFSERDGSDHRSHHESWNGRVMKAHSLEVLCVQTLYSLNEQFFLSRGTFRRFDAPPKVSNAKKLVWR